MSASSTFEFDSQNVAFLSAKSYYEKKLEGVKKLTPKSPPTIIVKSLKRDYEPAIFYDESASKFELVLNSDIVKKLKNNMATLVFSGVAFFVPDNFVLLLTMDSEPFRMSPLAIDAHLKGAEVGILLTKCGNSDFDANGDTVRLNMDAVFIRIDRTRMEKISKSKSNWNDDENKTVIGTRKDVSDYSRCLWKVINPPQIATDDGAALDFLPECIMVQRQRAPLAYGCFFPPLYYTRYGKMHLNAFIPKIICDGMQIVFNTSEEIGEFCGVDSNSASYSEYKTLGKKIKKLLMKNTASVDELNEMKAQVESLKFKIIQDRKAMPELVLLDKSDKRADKAITTTRVDKSTTTSNDQDVDIKPVERITTSDPTKVYIDSSTNTTSDLTAINESVKRVAENSDSQEQTNKRPKSE